MAYYQDTEDEGSAFTGESLAEEEDDFVYETDKVSLRVRRDTCHCMQCCCKICLGILAFVGAALVIGALVKGCMQPKPFQPLEPLPASAEWIIVGGGASGCSAATALADAGADVMLLERGPSDMELPLTKSALTWPKVITEALQDVRWTDGVWGGVAKVLGGGASLNGGLFFEEPADWLTAAFGPDVNTAMFHESYLFLKNELLTGLDTAFGRSGYSTDWIRAMGEMGLPMASELKMGPANGADADAWIAYSTYNTTTPELKRDSPARLVRDRLGMPNLHVVTMATVHEILWTYEDGVPRATGVKVHTGPNGTVEVNATKGVILSAGAILTPQLLHLSGVGPKSVLARLGKSFVVPDLPVGRNFIDRLILDWAVPGKQEIPLTVGYGITTNKSLGFTLESVGGGEISGYFAAASAGSVAPALRSLALREVIKIFFETAPDSITDIFNNAMQFVLLHRNPLSRGWIETVSTDPWDPPDVTPNYFSDPKDMESQFRAKDFLLALGQTDAMKAWVAEKIDIPINWNRDVDKPVRDYLECFFSPRDHLHPFYTLPCLPSSTTDAAWDEYLRKMVLSSYHYFGTAAVGDVLDASDFSVRGTRGLHVADASAIPVATSVNPQGTIMALGHYVGTLLAAKEVR